MGDGGAAIDGIDLFGPDFSSDPLASYRPHDPAADIFANASPDTAANWHALASGLLALCGNDINSLQGYLDRHVQDLGLAFRMLGDEQERAWPLNPMPLVIGAEEWSAIEAGLVQRAELLEAIVADVYGPQKLISGGYLPAAVVSGSTGFARRMVGVRPPMGRHLNIMAMDLARRPDGSWCVLADRARLPVGIGYAIENRIAMFQTSGGLLASVGTRRHADFLAALRKGFSACCEREDPRIALLTPGRFNQSYPEQAHLARRLGFSLVEGRDLVVREGKLYVRTIAGLKRIDAIWRWIGTRNLDPLNFDSRSKIGVPNLIAACEDGLSVLNWPGSSVVESRAMQAFMPVLAQTVLGQDLKLPNAATWWCGDAQHRRYVAANIDTLVISSAFKTPVDGLAEGRTRAGKAMSAHERRALEEGIARRPMDYSAQEIVRLSTTPVMANGRFEPRSFTMRAYLCRDGQGRWVAMPGGFVRLSERGELRAPLMGHGDVSADVVVVTHKRSATVSPQPLESPAVRRDLGLLSSQAADNLYWVGRYGERGHQMTRIIRTLLEQISGNGAQISAGTVTDRLCGLLRELGAVPPESIDWLPSRIAATALAERSHPGSVRALARTARQIALLLRDRLTRDAWRVMHRPMPPVRLDEAESMAACCDELIERFAAVARLADDGMSRSPAWRFLDMGICLERASMILQAVGSMVPGSASAEDLSGLLDLVDGLANYYSRYLAMPTIAPVLDQVLLDPAQPRGLAFQIARIEAHLSALPPLHDDGMPETQLQEVRALRVKIEGLNAAEINPTVLADLRQSLSQLSDSISDRYFLHDESPSAKDSGRFLA